MHLYVPTVVSEEKMMSLYARAVFKLFISNQEAHRMTIVPEQCMIQ
jgi:hypothetical protein